MTPSAPLSQRRYDSPYAVIRPFFYQGGLLLTVTSYVAVPPAFIFQIALLILLCMEQVDQVSTPNEKPRQDSDVITNITPQEHAPWMRRLLSCAKEDSIESARPLPWLTPSLVPNGLTLTWLSAGNTRTLCPNKNLSFCLWAIIAGEPQPYLVGPGSRHTHRTIHQYRNSTVHKDYVSCAVPVDP
jgi:hypothetical protein